MGAVWGQGDAWGIPWGQALRRQCTCVLMYGRSTVGKPTLHQTYTSAHLFDTLVTGLYSTMLPSFLMVFYSLGSTEIQMEKMGELISQTSPPGVNVEREMKYYYL